MQRTFLSGAAAAVLAAGIAAATGGAAHADEASCARMTNLRLPQTEITRAAWIEAADDLPAYCEVEGVIRPVTGSRIGVMYRLPDGWNGRVLGLGGSGWAGHVRIAPEGASQGLTRGYATMQTDAGAGAVPFDPSWALEEDGTLNETRMEDFSHRAIHLMTERGKQVTAAYYGEPHDHALYLGCSTGGRMGLMEVQRYPADYDGVIAGAPVYSLQTQTSQALRYAVFEAPGARLRPAHVPMVNRAVLTACDAQDGAADGILRDPRACDFDPRSLICEGEPKDTCLTETQAAALTRIYDGQRTADGRVAAYPLARGGEVFWENQPLASGALATFLAVSTESDAAANTGGLYALRGPLLGDPNYDLARLTPEDAIRVRDTRMAAIYEAKDTDISDFVAQGGRLILWHGLYDAGPSPLQTIDYYEAALEAAPDAEDSVRLFLAPGVGHCRGGNGPNQMDWLAAMERWILEGEAPEEVLATRTDSDLSWNLCAYPKLPTGQGDGAYACE